MLRFNLIACSLWFAIAACDTPPNDQANLNGLGGYRGLAGIGGAGGSAGGSSSTLLGGIRLLTPAQWSAIDESACTGTPAIDPSSYVFGFIIDASNSMSSVAPSTASRTKWQVVRDVISSSIGSIRDNAAAGLLIFPNEPTTPNLGLSQLPTDICVNTAVSVPVQTLGPAPSAQRDAIVNGLTNATPQGGTPTLDAYSYALNSFLLPALSNNSGVMPYLVLVTDGQPTFSAGCQGAGDEQVPVDTGPIIQAISSAATYRRVKTVVIGLPGSEQSSVDGHDGRIWLSEAAQAGDTPFARDRGDSGVPNYFHYDLSQVTDLQASLQEVLQLILVTPSSCEFTVPPSPSGAASGPNLTSVVYTKNGQTSDMYLIGQSEPTCAQGDGWYSDPNGQIELCPQTCATIQQDPTVRIVIRAGCYPLPWLI